MKTFEVDIECQACDGTGVYVGMGERDGAAVVCSRCKGTGKYHHKFTYTEFSERKRRGDVKRVYKGGYGYCISPTAVIQGEDFMEGEMPEHIEEIGCPMKVDQAACHNVGGFVDWCWMQGCGTGCLISDCPKQADKKECWDRFHSA